MIELNVPFLPDGKIVDLAESFLSKYNPSRSIPVPIEEIVEIDLRLEIIPILGLLKAVQVDGFTSSDLKTIYVDQWVLSEVPYRYRFTLAHEVGHVFMHREILRPPFVLNSVRHPPFLLP